MILTMLGGGGILSSIVPVLRGVETYAFTCFREIPVPQASHSNSEDPSEHTSGRIFKTTKRETIKRCVAFRQHISL